jgi:hypothetical protein
VNKPIFKPLYPSEGLARAIGGGAKYAQQKTQAPAAMCGASMLTAAGVAFQSLVKVQLPGRDPMPVTLYACGVAESGERKSANDAIAFKAHRIFDALQRELEQADREDFRKQLRLWRIRHGALARRLSRLIEKGAETADVEEQIRQQELARPVRRKRPRMLLNNLTPQALGRHLSEIFPSAIVVSAEGGTVRQTLSDTPMLNALWDDGVWSSARITRDEVDLRGVALSIHVQFQPAVLDKFLESAGLNYDNGFLARCLFYHPESTQGTRHCKYRDLPEAEMDAYYHVMRRALDRCAQAELPTPTILTLSPAAQKLLSWVQEALEADVGPKRWFSQMKGAANKAADICVRIAAILHSADEVPGTVIGVEFLRNAIKLVAWHLNEHKLHFCPNTEEELDAIELREWLDKKAPGLIRQTSRFSYEGPALSRICPGRLRGDVHRLKAAIKLLENQEQSVRLVEVKTAIGERSEQEQPGRASISRPTWFVQFTAWTPPAPPLERSDLPPFSSGRFWNRQAATAPVKEATVHGYVLWPGVVLPEE